METRCPHENLVVQLWPALYRPKADPKASTRVAATLRTLRAGSPPRPLTSVRFRGEVPTSYGHINAREFKEAAPATCNCNKAAEALRQTPRVTSPTPLTSGHREINQVQCKGPVPTASGCQEANELKESVPATYLHNKNTEIVRQRFRDVSPTPCNKATQFLRLRPQDFSPTPRLRSRDVSPTPLSSGLRESDQARFKEPVPTTEGCCNESDTFEGSAPATYSYNKANTAIANNKGNVLCPGTKVRLAGLRSEKYNERKGELVKFQFGKWQVQLEDGVVLMNVENLVVDASSLGHPEAARVLAKSKAVPNLEVPNPEAPVLSDSKFHADVQGAPHEFQFQSAAADCSIRQPEPSTVPLAGSLRSPPAPSRFSLRFRDAEQQTPLTLRLPGSLRMPSTASPMISPRGQEEANARCRSCEPPLRGIPRISDQQPAVRQQATPAAFRASLTSTPFSARQPTPSRANHCGGREMNSHTPRVSIPATQHLFGAKLPRFEQLFVKLVVFDFDCTLSAFHVFASLADIRSNSKLPVPPPHALTERGQLQKLVELDADPNWGPGAFARYAFGGEERVAQLRKALVALAHQGIECIICSRGFVGPIRKCLDQLHLLPLFANTLCSLGSRFGTSDYDDKVAADGTLSQEHYLGSADMDVQMSESSSKLETIERYVRSRGLEYCQAIFLDDDINELINARVRTIHVAGENGICEHELRSLRGLVNAIPPCQNVVAMSPTATPSTPATDRVTDDSSIASAFESVSATGEAEKLKTFGDPSKV